MKERPINMRAEEVRAILAGRKTQFRRVVKWPLLSKSDGTKQRMLIEADAPQLVEILKENTRRHPHIQFRPFGAPGDRLWVRETWTDISGMGFDSHLFPSKALQQVAYRADCSSTGSLRLAKEYGVVWSPSVHMPRKFSRITLEIVSVRVKRLQDISEEDAKAEGVEIRQDARIAAYVAGDSPARMEFWHLWRSINGPRSWDENPWVRAVEFRVIEGGAA